MKNGFISEQFKLQEQDIKSLEQKIEINQENMFSINFENKKDYSLSFNVDNQIDRKRERQITSHQLNSQKNNLFTPSSIDFLSNSNIPEEQIPKPKKKKKKRRQL